MKEVSLLFGVHLHQPVDNLGFAVDEAIEKCYRPFFETMLNYPEFKFSLHCSGWLLDQIRLHHPDIFQAMKTLTKKGTIEWISAGFYEPILSVIPSHDRVAQIEKLNTFIKKHFKKEPHGLWLTERVWESSIVPDLNKAAMEFALIDDYHFLSSGFDANSMDGYFQTEESGKKLALFPISGALRYALPFFNTKRAIDAILDCKKHDDSAAIIFDDGEKFGLWPKTHEWVYEKKWLEKFIEAVLEDTRIKTEHFSDYLRQNRSRGIAYLNNTSYFEMGEWSLKSEQTLGLEALKTQVGTEYFDHEGIAFIKGGIWKNFFVKYEESNYLHKRMLYMSQRQAQLKTKAKENLYKLQTNDVFWHGVFGGLYLPNLRDNAYHYLMALEKEFATKNIQYEVSDIDMDGYDELKVLSKQLSLVFSSKNGAQMIEFGTLDGGFNWQNTLTRRKEAYHDKILNPSAPAPIQDHHEDAIATIHHAPEQIDERLRENLIFDWHLKYSFVDHLLLEPIQLSQFKAATFREIGDFANQPFELDAKNQTFTRQGGIYLEQHYPTELSKKFSFSHTMVSLDCHVKTDYKGVLYYGVEFNLHFAHPKEVRFNGEAILDGLVLHHLEQLIIFDSFTNKTLTLSMNQPFDCTAFILNTVSQSENGFDLVAQQISFILTLPCHDDEHVTLSLGVKDV
ncbi:alpha-amylase/4-alpha-glucanotransferase domain-containing protein [Sulfurospirillum sp. 1612]|uniref:alpha-amylase/4-alpha-glucanotransferase domain-containing protein n=1 Tax=Sulfurospirillum sp. 1612 TaxID=3094835 RepID=UPI002F928FA0